MSALRSLSMRKPPSYRKKKSHNAAIVTLTDSQTGKRKDYLLGEFDSPASREAYHRLISEWEASGRTLPNVVDADVDENGITIETLCLEYWLHCKEIRAKPELSKLKSVIRLICKYHGSSPANSFGPRSLSNLVPHMVAGDPDESPPRKPWARAHINEQLGRIKRMFKWGVARELVNPSVFHGLAAVENLRKGASGAKEGKKVMPVDLEVVERTKPLLVPQLQALIDLQVLTGARPGELLIMRPKDIDRSQKIWLYTPAKHKRSHAGKSRSIFIGPRAQCVITPYLDRDNDAYLFSPAEAETERRGKAAARSNAPGDHYTTASYGRAIQRACAKGKLPHWTPHQLRHTAATKIRAQFGLEAAQLMLGHSSALVTEAVYAERDQSKGMEIAGQVG
jgi:integrase